MDPSFLLKVSVGRSLLSTAFLTAERALLIYGRNNTPDWALGATFHPAL
jgi:hypothetical protein